MEPFSADHPEIQRAKAAGTKLIEDLDSVSYLSARIGQDSKIYIYIEMESEEEAKKIPAEAEGFKVQVVFRKRDIRALEEDEKS